MHNEKTRSRNKIIVYYALTLLLSVPWEWLAAQRGLSVLLATGVMWMPALAACLTTWIFRERVRNFAWGLGKPRWLHWGYPIPLCYALPVYLVVWLGDWGGFDPSAFVAKTAQSLGMAALPTTVDTSPTRAGSSTSSVRAWPSPARSSRFGCGANAGS